VIVDTSAVLAILLQEAEADPFIDILGAVPIARMSVASYLEASIFLDRNFDEVRRAMLDSFVREFEIRLEPVTIEQIHMARQAYVFFGKGRHRASLNFGDCFTYALAKAYAEPVLYKGNDFSKTDIESSADQIH
jgi:ribonuclease VapC